MCRRLGCTGSSTPASRATRAAAGPAALITSGEAIAPAEVITPLTRPCVRSSDETRTPSAIFTPSSRARRAKPAGTPERPARPSPGPRLARGPRADRLALHDDDVRETAPREMVGDAAADDTATDHHRARCSRQVHVVLVLVLWAGTRGPIVPRLAATPG